MRFRDSSAYSVFVICNSVGFSSKICEKNWYTYFFKSFFKDSSQKYGRAGHQKTKSEQYQSNWVSSDSFELCWLVIFLQGQHWFPRHSTAVAAKRQDSSSSPTPEMFIQSFSSKKLPQILNSGRNKHPVLWNARCLRHFIAGMRGRMIKLSVLIEYKVDPTVYWPKKIQEGIQPRPKELIHQRWTSSKKIKII